MSAKSKNETTPTVTPAVPPSDFHALALIREVLQQQEKASQHLEALRFFVAPEDPDVMLAFTETVDSDMSLRDLARVRDRAAIIADALSEIVAFF